MDEDEGEGKADGGGDGSSGGDTPGQACEELEGGEEIGEGRVGLVVCVFCLCDIPRLVFCRVLR